MRILWSELFYGLRLLSKKPLFALVAIGSLAVAIGINSAMFSLMNAVLIQPLNYRNPNELVVIWKFRSGQKDSPTLISAANFTDLQEHAGFFAAVGAVRLSEVTVTNLQEPANLRAAAISNGFLSVLGVSPALGREFFPGEEHVALISHRLWNERFSSDSKILGKPLALNGQTHTVVGVAPPGLNLLPAGLRQSEIEVWMPLDLAGRARGSDLFAIGRMKPNVSIKWVQTQMDSLVPRLGEKRPGSYGNIDFGLTSLHEEIAGDQRLPLLVLQAALILVLLLCSLNLAGLYWTRALRRKNEFSIRAALGAGRFLLWSQFLLESLTITIPGLVLGLFVAGWMIQLFPAMIPNRIPLLDQVGIDATVMGFAVLLTVFTTMLCTVTPALGTLRSELNASLTGSRAASAKKSGWVRKALVIAEVAMAMLLLVGAGLMLNSFRRVMGIDKGFGHENLLVVELSLPPKKYPHHRIGLRREFWRQLMEKVQMISSLESFGVSSNIPLQKGLIRSSFEIEGRQNSAINDFSARIDSADPGYFSTLGISFKKGRPFLESDTSGTVDVAVINEAFQRNFFPDLDPLGQRIRVYDSWLEIVGVIQDVRIEGLDIAPGPEIYLHSFQHPFWVGRYLTLRSSQGEFSSLASAIQSFVSSIDKEQPIKRIATMDQILSESIASPRFNTLLLTVFALASLALATMGLYGTLTISAVERMREISIRMAIGACKGDIVKLVLKQGVILGGSGLCIGLLGALLLTQTLSSLLFEISALDLETYLAVTALFAAVILLACYLPARRATSTDPLEGLRAA